MPDFTDLSQAISTLKGLHDGSIDPNTIDLPEDMQDPEAETSEEVSSTETETDNSTVETENTDETDTEKEEDSTEQQSEKKVQTPEENRKFAEQRRQQELDKRVQEELNKRLQESPEVKLAKMMAEQFGVSPEVMLQEIQLGQMQEQNPDIPVDVLRQQLTDQAARAEAQQREASMQEQLANLQYQLWERDVKLQASDIQKQFPVLTDDDMQATMDYMLETLGTTNIPLKQAVMAIHGDKIIEYQTTQARNEILAEKSGRKSPIAPQGGKSTPTPVLSPEEKQVAQMMGISEEDYLKYK